MAGLTPEQILKILELTDSHNLHREAVLIPLATEENGGVTVLADGRLRIAAASNKSFEEWFSELRVQLMKMDLSALRRTS